MIKRPRDDLLAEGGSFANLMRTLGETFTIADVMVPLPEIEFVAPGEEARANELAAQKRYSVVPISEDGRRFESVIQLWIASHEPEESRKLELHLLPTTFLIQRRWRRRYSFSGLGNGISLSRVIGFRD